MKTKRLIVTLLVFAIMATTLFGCSSSNTPTTQPTDNIQSQPPSSPPVSDPTPSQTTSDAEQITVIDDAGHEANLTPPITRVVVVDSGPGAALSALGVTELIVGNHTSLTNALFDTIADVPVVATNSEINYEAIAEAEPQLVISATSHHGFISEGDHLDDFGIEFIALDLRTPSRMRDDFRLLGKVFQKEAEAQKVIDFYDKYQSLIDERLAGVAEEDRPTVFLEMHAGAYHTGSPESQFYQQIELAGGRNVADDLADNPLADDVEVSAEWVAEKNPDYIVRETSPLRYTATTADDAIVIYDEIMARPGLATVTAIKEGNIFMIGNDIFSRPGYIVGICYLAKEFHPDLFEDLDPDAVLAEWFELAYPGKPVGGVWTYSK